MYLEFAQNKKRVSIYIYISAKYGYDLYYIVWMYIIVFSKSLIIDNTIL